MTKKLGFEIVLNKLKNEVEKVKQELNNYKDLLNKTKEDYAELSEAIEIIQKMRRAGIRPEKIATWHKILTSSKLKPEELEKAIRQYSNLQKLIADKSRELKNMGEKAHRTEIKSI